MVSTRRRQIQHAHLVKFSIHGHVCARNMQSMCCHIGANVEMCHITIIFLGKVSASVSIEHMEITNDREASQPCRFHRDGHQKVVAVAINNSLFQDLSAWRLWRGIGDMDPPMSSYRFLILSTKSSETCDGFPTTTLLQYKSWGDLLPVVASKFEQILLLDIKKQETSFTKILNCALILSLPISPMR